VTAAVQYHLVVLRPVQLLALRGRNRLAATQLTPGTTGTSNQLGLQRAVLGSEVKSFPLLINLGALNLVQLHALYARMRREGEKSERQ